MVFKPETKDAMVEISVDYAMWSMNDNGIALIYELWKYFWDCLGYVIKYRD